MHTFILFTLLVISTQEIVPSTAPAAAPKGGSDISKFDSDKKATKASQDGPDSSPPPSLCQCINPCPIQQANALTQGEKAKSDSLDRLYRRYMLATILGVIVALVGVGALIYQTQVTRESSQQQLRAYVVQELGSIVNVANPIPAFRGEVISPTGAEITNYAVGPVVSIQIKNTGQTPAFDVKHWADICFREYPLKSELPAPPSEMKSIPSSILGPGIISTKKRYLSDPLSATQIAELRAGKSAVYLYGGIRYRDAFKVKRFTKYRFMHSSFTGPIGVTTDLTFAEEGNEAN
jgi:hypothetical protein